MDIHYTRLQPHQSNLLSDLVCLYAGVFETTDFKMPPVSWLEKLLQDEKIIFMAAFTGGELAGGLTAYILPSVYTGSCSMYLYDLAVKPALQRKGIGKQLLQELTSYCSNAACTEIFVQAEAGDLHAIDFYRAIGGREDNAVQFSFSL